MNLYLRNFFEKLQNIRQMQAWVKRGYLENSPQFVKQRVFEKYGIPNAQWVETGTFLGTTTSFLAANYPRVFSVEPSEALYKKAKKRFLGSNVTLYNDVSENVLPTILPNLSGDINFWLDGHYSAGVIFKGDKECPVEDELNAIQENLERFAQVTILIDDVRCFLPDSTFDDSYPSIDYLVDWSRENGFAWRIEHDIFVMLRS